MSNVDWQDFAKIVRATTGEQVLFYIEPEGGDYKLHQITQCELGQVDLSIGFTSKDEDKNEKNARIAFSSIGIEHADKVIKAANDFLNGGAK